MLEINLGWHGVRVYGYDAFQPVVEFWKYYLSEPETFVAEAQETLRRYDRAWFVELHKRGFADVEDPYTRGVLFYLLNRMSYRGMTFRSHGLVSDYTKRLQPQNFRETLTIGKSIQNVTVKQQDCFETLRQHPDTFAICDPPYYGLSEGLYGDSPAYHEDFDHERLYAELENREGWMCCYNEHEFIKDLYDDFNSIFLTRQADVKVRDKREVLIFSHDVWEASLLQPKQMDFNSLLLTNAQRGLFCDSIGKNLLP